jgi:hypothetical protein
MTTNGYMALAVAIIAALVAVIAAVVATRNKRAVRLDLIELGATHDAEVVCLRELRVTMARAVATQADEFAADGHPLPGSRALDAVYGRMEGAQSTLEAVQVLTGEASRAARDGQ